MDYVGNVLIDLTFWYQLEFAPLYHNVQAAIAEVLEVANERVSFHADAQRRRNLLQWGLRFLLNVSVTGYENLTDLEQHMNLLYGPSLLASLLANMDPVDELFNASVVQMLAPTLRVFLCQQGTFASTIGASTCMDCSAGSFETSAGASTCESCPSGRYSSIYGASTSLVCQSCSIGQYSSTVHSTTCFTCNIGHYTDSATMTYCTGCPSYSTTIETGATSKMYCLCNGGYYGSNGGPCTPCPAGTYNEHYGGTAIDNCTICQAGTFSSAGLYVR